MTKNIEHIELKREGGRYNLFNGKRSILKAMAKTTRTKGSRILCVNYLHRLIVIECQERFGKKYENEKKEKEIVAEYISIKTAADM